MTLHSIRPLRAEDILALTRMVHALATFHGDAATVTAENLIRDCLGASPWLRVLVAEGGAGLCGYVALSPRVQMQFGRRGMDMHHLFVDEPVRGRGVGHALVTAAIETARSMEVATLQVGTAPENIAAQGFYRALGFADVASNAQRFLRDLEQA